MHHDHHVEQLFMFELFSVSVPSFEMCKWQIQPEQAWRSQKNLLEKQNLTHPPPSPPPILPFLPFSNGSSLSCAHNSDNFLLFKCSCYRFALSYHSSHYFQLLCIFLYVL